MSADEEQVSGPGGSPPRTIATGESGVLPASQRRGRKQRAAGSYGYGFAGGGDEAACHARERRPTRAVSSARGIEECVARPKRVASRCSGDPSSVSAQFLPTGDCEGNQPLRRTCRMRRRTLTPVSFRNSPDPGGERQTRPVNGARYAPTWTSRRVRHREGQLPSDSYPNEGAATEFT